MVIGTMRHKSQQIFDKIGNKIKNVKINIKYIIILGLGIIFMLVGNGMSDKDVSQKKEQERNVINGYELENILESIQGAGKVRVFISYKNDGKKEIAQQIERSENGIRNTPEEIGDTYYVLSESQPEIAGVLITATGAIDPYVQMKLLSATKHALGIPYSRICVQVGEKGGH